MVGNNAINNSLNERFNCCLELFLDRLDILSIVCGTWCGLSESSLIVWSEDASYIHISGSATIVSQLVENNLVFNHNSG